LLDTVFNSIPKNKDYLVFTLDILNSEKEMLRLASYSLDNSNLYLDACPPEVNIIKLENKNNNILDSSLTRPAKTLHNTICVIRSLEARVSLA
jgi:hypothetical protein